ncbi:hypothetical protein CDAR_67411 [Caerostris darwini]|uniref:Uncharacterized protein n=1 Tax=Caerostris darwini TaxID=1538125 RepID=A0AAV4U8C5_9ARAC|nr:hypothetical protein CDAR_67411 [Caerostris darwini]
MACAQLRKIFILFDIIRFATIRTALSQLLCHLDKFTRAVILCDSKTAMFPIVSDSNPLTQDILDCRLHLQNLTSLEKNITPQRVPAYCQVSSNKKAGYLVKKDALIMPSTFRPITFCAFKCLVKRF